MEAVRPLPAGLRTFEAFQAGHWINPVTGTCEAAPWTAADFHDRIGERLADSLRGAGDGDLPRLAEGFLFAAALGDRAGVRPETLRDAAAVLTDPAKTSVGRDPGRMSRLREAPAGADLRLGLVLEAVRPSAAADLPFGDELARLLDRADFRDPALRGVVGGLILHHGQSDLEPTAQLRSALGKPSPAREDWPAELTRRRERLRAEVVRVTLNAGSPYVGQFRHCGAAWSRFMTRCLLPVAKPMYPGEEPLWNPDVMAQRIGALAEEHKRIADAAIARDNARRSMDRAVDRLVELLTDANEACRQVARTSARRNARPSNDLVAEARRFVAGQPAGDPAERLARLLLQRVLDPGPPVPHPLALGPGFFAAHPSLLDGLAGRFDPSTPPAADRLAVPPRVAAAALLAPVVSGRGAAPSWGDLEAQLRERGWYDRLAVLRGELPPGDRGAAAQERNRLLVGVQIAADRVRRAWRGLEALRVPSHRENRAAAEWAGTPDAAGHDPQLVAEWLDRVAAASAEQLRAARAGWEAGLAADPADRPRLAALREGRFDAAVRGADAAAGDRPLRETAWRGEAAATYPNPRQTLRDLSETSPVAEKWLGDLSDRATRSRNLPGIRSEFTKWVFGKDLWKPAEKDRNVFAIDTAHLRRHLAPLQPTYLPQLHAVGQVVVVTAPEGPADRDYVRRVVDAAREHGENAAVAVLCPGVAGPVRDQIRRQLQGTNLFAGTVDDLDLCRLLAPAGTQQPNPLIGLFEIVLEQQPWKARNPFAVPEGSEMRLEMYVGRREEAKQLATTADKTRLFSGRKLGKTALLQFIRQTENGRELANKQRLRVVYVSIVGVGREDLFARMVLDQLRRDFPDAGLPAALPDPTALLAAIQLLLDRRPKDDLLIVLDEADEFVATQVRDDQTRQGQTLSWKLRGNPRVRYVFTGYWATSTRDGVWYNWGDVLELDQLRLEDAAGLVARPLARLGINAADQAAEIAFRCGCQPAVLLRFGERLVERLAAEEGFREGAEIDLPRVQDTFEDARVQTEIQGVVRANFQGNPFGQAVFTVVLRESASAPLGQWLRGLESAVAGAIREAAGPAAEGDLAPQVAAQLKDMHRRKLLLRRQANGHPEYQLKFPHHLAALLSDLDLETELRANLRAWRETQAGAGAAPAAEGRSPLRRTDLATLRDLLGPQMGGMVAAVGSPWPAALWHEPGGVPDRLGLPPATPAAGRYAPDAPHRCWRDAGPDHLRRVLADPPAGRGVLLLGGVDLLRDGVERRNRGEPVEPVGPYRMSDGQVRWWFQRNLGVEFPTEAGYAQVHNATRGVPLLVGEFQSLLLPAGPRPGGDSVDRERLDAALDDLRRRLADPKFADRLAVLLTPREIDLLRMAHVARVFAADGPMEGELTGDWSAGVFGDEWAARYPDRPFPPPYLADPADPVAVEVLLATGFLPVADGAGEPIARARPLPLEDPVTALLAALG